LSANAPDFKLHIDLLPARPEAELVRGRFVSQTIKVAKSEGFPGAFVVVSGQDIICERKKSLVERSGSRISSDPSTRSTSFNCPKDDHGEHNAGRNLYYQFHSPLPFVVGLSLNARSPGGKS
jgi:hypothetical protein